ncbi:MAG: TIGR01777 family oxidoreductase [Capsulimonadaceae bacterium]
MRIVLTGSSGLIGSAVRARLTGDGHTVVPLVRRKPEAGEVAWDPDAGVLDATHLGSVDAVVHLAGEGIAAKRWTAVQKDRILTSRVRGTELIAATIARMPVQPAVLISASAIGYYGDRSDEILTESSGAGKGFLAETCRQWEQSTGAASDAGIRVVLLRFGVVLAAHGGALAKMLPPFRMGLGGVVGSGRQWMSWITLPDITGIVEWAVRDAKLSGAVNAVSPHAITNADFTRALGKAIRRPTAAPLPSFAARIIFGEMADELLLASSRVEPAKLKEAGYAFQHSDINSAMRSVFDP